MITLPSGFDHEGLGVFEDSRLVVYRPPNSEPVYWQQR